ncbi:MAG: winged helix-turn-helix domain-containing protein [Micrococcales bacterium]
MSLAILNDYRSSVSTPAPALTSVDTAAVAKGFGLYVGLTEEQALAAGVSLSDVVAALRNTLTSLVPSAASYAAVALAPASATGNNLDLVRTALRDPRALDKLVTTSESGPAKGLVVDFNRHRVYVDGRNAEFTNREFDLLTYLIDLEGVTVSRADLVVAVWGDDISGEVINERTVDVHVRRLRAKIAGYEDVIRTIRGGGYRFDKHPDVLVEA